MSLVRADQARNTSTATASLLDGTRLRRANFVALRWTSIGTLVIVPATADLAKNAVESYSAFACLKRERISALIDIRFEVAMVMLQMEGASHTWRDNFATVTPSAW